jgi:ABC-2 type transport system permease protein
VTRLLNVELRRFFARRVTRWLCAALLLGVVAAGIGSFLSTSNDLAAARRSAQRQAQFFQAEQAKAHEDCVAHAPPDEVEQACNFDGEQPTATSFYRDPRFSFHDHVQDLIRTGVILGSLVALILAASLIGAEWQAGTFAALLTWEPRRRRVAAAKVAAVVAGTLVVAAVGTGLLLGTEALVAATHGTFHTVLQDARPQPHFTRATWAMAGRGACVVALVAAMGAGLALLLRHTVAAVGVAIGYLIVGEGIIGSLRHGDVRHHLLQSRLDALLNGTYSWPIPIRTADGGVEFSPQHRVVVHALEAGLEVVALVALLLLIATFILQRRDVT